MLHPSVSQGEIFRDRGDPSSANDFSLTTDATWRTLDLSSVVPVRAAGRYVLLRLRLVANDGVPAKASFREPGNTYANNAAVSIAYVVASAYYESIFVKMDLSRQVEYNYDNVTWLVKEILVRGWFERA